MRTLLSIILFTVVLSAQAADTKIGIVMTERILAEAPQIESVNSEMLKKFSGRQEELADMETEIKKMQEDYGRNELVMTQDKLEEMQKQIIGQIQLYKQKEAMLNQEVNTMRQEKLAGLQQMIRGIIRDIAKEDEYDIVFSDGVVHTEPEFDITDKVLERMKKEFK